MTETDTLYIGGPRDGEVFVDPAPFGVRGCLPDLIRLPTGDVYQLRDGALHWAGKGEPS